MHCEPLPKIYFDAAMKQLDDVRHLTDKVRYTTACPGNFLTPTQTNDLIQNVLISINKLNGLAESLETSLDLHEPDAPNDFG